MKKIVLALFAALCMTTVSAANLKDNEINSAKAYEVNFNIYSLSQALNLKQSQTELLQNAQESFSDDMRKAKYAKDEAGRKAAIDNALMRNVKYMSEVLDKAQYRKYLMLLNATIVNRGLNF